MSVVIIGGNECMQREYKNLCKAYNCNVKIYPKMSSCVNNIGNPDLLVVFTSTASHKLVKKAIGNTSSDLTIIERSHSSSLSALRCILDKHTS